MDLPSSNNSSGSTRTLFGSSIRRVEDDRLLTGRGRYVGDIARPGMVDMTVVRSTLPHALLTAVDTTAARAFEGVLACVTARDLVDVKPIPDLFPYAGPVQEFPLAIDRVRYVGSPIAAVVAEDRYRAEDAAELVVPDFEPLPAVVSMADALAPGAPKLYDDWDDNKAIHIPSGQDPEVTERFRGARTISGTYTIQRHTAVPLETRGCVAEFEDGRLTLTSSTQFPHILRTVLSWVLPLPERRIRVVVPDVGGGFGCKAEVYAEEILACWLAMRLRRPVRWIEDRAEHMVATGHSRDNRIELEAAVDENGTILALRGHVYQDIGSGEIYPPGFTPGFVTQGSITGPYKIPCQDIGLTCVVTNKTPSGAYRGFGSPEAAFVMERIIDKIARTMGFDVLDVRRRMILDPEDLPYVTPTGAKYDSGSHREAFEAVVALGREAAEGARRELAGDDRVRVGLGIANYVQGVVPSYFGTGGYWGSQETCNLRFDPDGGLVATVGVSAFGQSILTMVHTLASELLGVPTDQIRVNMGDTDATPYGLGSWGARSTVVVAGAMAKAAVALRQKALEIAAHMLEVAAEDLTIDDGRFHVRGAPERSLGWPDVARVAYLSVVELPPAMEAGLDASGTYEPPGIDHVPHDDGRMNACATYTNASHAIVVKVDIETGTIHVLRQIVAHDCGVVINPMIVKGQVHGGVAQGIGGALLECNAYAEDGQPLATSLMDYLLPSTMEVPPITVEHFESPAPEMPFGIKGAGEAGLTGTSAAIVSAIEDALIEFDIDEIAFTPVTPAVIRSLLDKARVSAGRRS